MITYTGGEKKTIAKKNKKKKALHGVLLNIKQYS